MVIKVGFSLFLCVLEIRVIIKLISCNDKVPIQKTWWDFFHLKVWLRFDHALLLSINVLIEKYLLHQNSTHYVDWYEVVKNSILSVSITYFEILLAYFLYKSFYLSVHNWNIWFFFFVKRGLKRIIWDKILNFLYDWSYNHTYIDAFYTRYLDH